MKNIIYSCYTYFVFSIVISILMVFYLRYLKNYNRMFMFMWISIIGMLLIIMTMIKDLKENDK